MPDFVMAKVCGNCHQPNDGRISRPCWFCKGELEWVRLQCRFCSEYATWQLVMREYVAYTCAEHRGSLIPSTPVEMGVLVIDGEWDNG